MAAEPAVKSHGTVSEPAPFKGGNEVIGGILGKALAHKLIILALATTAGDVATTAEFQSRVRDLPPAGVFYLGTDDLFHKSPGPRRDLLLGSPSNLQIGLEIPAATIGTLVARHKFPRASTDALIGESAFHAGGIGLNLANMPPRFPRPVCVGNAITCGAQWAADKGVKP